MSKNKKLKFRTKKSMESAKAKRFIIAFFSFIIVFGSISVLILLKEYNFNLSNIFNAPQQETEVSETTHHTLASITGSANFLVYCLSDDGSNIRFIAVINADMKTNSFKVCSLSPKSRATVQTDNQTLANHFQAGGVQRLIQAVDALGGIKIDRYVCSTDTGFKNAINDLDGLELNIPKNINYQSGGLSLTLVKGMQTLKGDALLKYLQYNGTLGDAGLDTQSQVLCAMLDQYINVSNAAKGEKLYSSLINSINSSISGSDITIFDYISSKAAIEQLVTATNRPAAKAEPYLQSFTNSGTRSAQGD